MRYLVVILLILISRIANSQVTDTQLRVRADQEPDSILVMSNDTNSSSAYYRTGKWRKLSDLIGSVAGDTDWWKLGGTAIPTNSDSAYRSGYTLFTGLNGGLATMIEVLKDGSINFDYENASSGETKVYQTVQPLQQNEGNVPWVSSIFTAANYGARFNDVHSMGWNMEGGNVLEAGKQAFGWVCEGWYQQDADKLRFEDHTIWYGTDGVQRRPESLVITDGYYDEWYKYFTVNDLFGLDPRNNNKSFQFALDGIDTSFSKLYLWSPNSANTKGAEFLWNTTTNRLSISPVGTSNSKFDVSAFPYSRHAMLQRLNVASEIGQTMATIAGNSSEGYFGDITTGWGVDLTSDVLLVDSSQVATQYDLTTAAGTNLSISQSGGTQVIQSSTGTDVGVRNLYGLLITEGAADTLHFRVDSSLIATQYDITQIPINSIKSATATNTANHTNYAQEWTWNTLAGTTGLKLSSTSTVAASNLHKLFEVSTTGINGTSSQSTYAGYFSNTHSGTGHINYGLYSTISGGNASSSALYGNVANSTGNGVTGAAVSGYGISGSSTGNSGIYGLSSTASSGRHGVHAEKNTSNTNNMDYPLGIYSYSTGTPAAGFGGGMQFWNEPATGSTALLSNTIETAWTTATTASAVSKMTFKGMDAATLQDLMVLAGSGRTTLSKYGAGTFTAGTPTYNIVVDASGNLMEAAVPVGGLNVVEENNVVVQSANVNIDFQNPFDVATDGANEVNISLDCGEFTTVTGIEADDYMLMHDSGMPQNQKILWSDVLIDLISFKDGNSSVGTGNTIDVGEGLDIAMSPSTEANINLDASEFQIDGVTDAGEYVLIHDSDTTAGHQIQRRLVSSFSGGTDTNFAEDDLTFTGNRSHDMGIYSLTMHGTAANVYIQDDNGGTGNTLVLVSELGAGTGITGGISFQSENAGTPTEQYDIEAEKLSTNQSILRISGEQATDAEINYEKNADLSNNTTESHLAINGGIAFTQNYDISTSGDLDLDRSYYTVNITGGSLTDTIKLPEVAATLDNWTSTLSATQVQVGQEYVISNLRSGVNLVISAYNPGGTADDLIGTRTAPGGSAGSAISIAPGKSVIVKCYQFASNIGYWNYWLSN